MDELYGQTSDLTDPFGVAQRKRQSDFLGAPTAGGTPIPGANPQPMRNDAFAPTPPIQQVVQGTGGDPSQPAQDTELRKWSQDGRQANYYDKIPPYPDQDAVEAKFGPRPQVSVMPVGHGIGQFVTGLMYAKQLGAQQDWDQKAGRMMGQYQAGAARANAQSLDAFRQGTLSERDIGSGRRSDAAKYGADQRRAGMEYAANKRAQAEAKSQTINQLFGDVLADPTNYDPALVAMATAAGKRMGQFAPPQPAQPIFVQTPGGQAGFVTPPPRGGQPGFQPTDIPTDSRRFGMPDPNAQKVTTENDVRDKFGNLVHKDTTTSRKPRAAAPAAPASAAPAVKGNYPPNKKGLKDNKTGQLFDTDANGNEIQGSARYEIQGSAR